MTRVSIHHSELYPPPRRGFQTQFRRCRVALSLALLAAALVPAASRATLHSEWSDHYDLGNTPVHVVISPSADPNYHSQILWWRGKDRLSRDFGGLLKWKALPDGDFTQWPSAAIDTVKLDFPGKDVFCAGHTHLGDGRLMVSGGTMLDGFEVGTYHNMLFDPKTATWDSTTIGDMSERRWYPSATLLGDNRVLVTSGSKYFQAHLFGGVAGSASLPSDRTIHRQRVTSFGGEDPAVGPVGNEPWPQARTGHSLSNMSTRWGAEVYFGGLRDDGQYTNDVWFLYRGDDSLASDYKYTWVQRTPTGAIPVPRSEAVTAGLEGEVLVWGGRNGSQLLQSSELRAFREGAAGQFTWNVVIPSGTAPTARYGHGVAIREVQDQPDTMYMTGGATAIGALPSDPKVYSLSYESGGAAAWSELALAPGSPVPPPCRGHVFFMDPDDRQYSLYGNIGRRAILFGGVNSSNAYSDTIWVLWFKFEGPTWQPVVAPASAGLGRERCGYAFDKYTQRLYIYGGEAGGVRKKDVRWVALDSLWTNTISPRQWRALPDLPQEVSGLTATFVTNVAFSRRNEVYDPAAWGTAPAWTRLSPLKLDWYPFGFTIPDAISGGRKVFVAGPGRQAWWVNPNDSLSSATKVGTYSAVRGGSAVMYETGKIMKCGTRDTDGYRKDAVGTTESIDLTTGTTWATRGSMYWPRVNHNLVMLPTGEVLVTGGTAIVDNTQDFSPRVQPEIWNPTTGQWYGGGTTGDFLKSDPHQQHRGYHSTAILLPDGRVLCGGGNATNDPGHLHDRNSFNIFAPPYLFDASGAVATRPQFLSTPREVSWGQLVTLRTDVVADHFVLLRPGAVTHAFNEEQRYIKLNPTALDTPGVASVEIPFDRDEVPPGDYYLFAMKGGVPSMARWVHVDLKPQRINTLNVACPVASTFKVSWVAPHDESIPSDVATNQYELRFRDGAPVDTTDLTTSALITMGIPRTPGLVETRQLTVTAGHLCYFRVRSRDRSLQWSPWSNSTYALALASGSCGGTGGGGGGGGHEGTRAEQATSMFPHAPVASEGNSLLNGERDDLVVCDVMPLEADPVGADGVARAWVHQYGPDALEAHALRLLAVDHDPDVEVVAGPRGVHAGHRTAAASVVRTTGGTATSVDVTTGYATAPGDTLVVVLDGGAGDPLVMHAAGAYEGDADDSTGILVQAEVGSLWQTQARLNPRQQWSDLMVDSLGSSRIRLVSLGHHSFDFVGHLARLEAGLSAQWLTPSAVFHSTLGELPDAFTSGPSVIVPGERLTAAFTPPPASDRVRSWFMELTGARVAGGAASSSARSGQSGDVPLQFALATPRPNPAARSTSLRFAVPRASEVRIDVFDLLGRRVASLARGSFAPGWHEARWDGRTRSGALAAPGAYLVRMTSAGFDAHRKVVLLP